MVILEICTIWRWLLSGSEAWANIGGSRRDTWHIVRHHLRGCFLGYETKGVGKLSGECHGRWSVVVVMMVVIMFSDVTMRRVHVWEHGGRSRTASAWKSLGPRHTVRSLIEPTLVTKQFSVTDSRAAPGRCLRGIAVKASAAYAVTEFRTCVVRVDDLVGSDPWEELIKSAPWTGNELR